ncbi:hypothetical protein U0070_002140, partial [Myodes glareolus]
IPIFSVPNQFPAKENESGKGHLLTFRKFRTLSAGQEEAGPSDELVTYDSELYSRQTQDYYAFMGSDGDSHSGEYTVRLTFSQPGLGPGLETDTDP